MGLFRSPEGAVIDVPDEHAAAYKNNGYTPVSDDQRAADIAADATATRGAGVLGGIKAGITSFASGATFGASDALLASLGTESNTEDIRDARAAHPYVSGAANVAGAIVPAFVAPESMLGRSPAGYLARAASDASEAAKALGGVKALAGVAAVSGTEAAAQSAGMYLSDVALGDRELTAEGLAGALGRGFAFGSVAGGAVLGIEKGTMAARRMFARAAEGGTKAAKLAEATWSRTSEDVLSAGEETAAIAKKRLDEIRVAKGEASLAKSKAQAELAQAKLDAFKGSRAPAEPPVGDVPAPAPEPAAPAPAEAPAPAPAAPAQAPAEVPPPPAATAIEPPAAVAPAVEAAPSAAPAQQPIPDGLTLEQKLAEMKSRVDGGASIQDLNVARTAKSLGPDLAAEEEKLTAAVTNFADRKAAVDAWINKYKNPRIRTEADWSPGAGRSGGMPVVRSRMNTPLAEDVIVEQSGGGSRVIGQGADKIETITPNTRILARSNHADFEAGSHLDEAYADALERAKAAETPEMRAHALREAADTEEETHAFLRDHSPHNKAVIDRIEAVRKEAGTTGYHAAEARVEKAAARDALAHPGKRYGVDPEQEAEYQATLAGNGPRGPVSASWMKKYQLAESGRPATLVDEVHEAAETLGAYEKAHAELVEAVGDAAPQSAKDATAAYRDAEATAERKQYDRTSRAIDDHAEANAKAQAESVATGKPVEPPAAAAPPPAAPAPSSGGSAPASEPTAPPPTGKQPKPPLLTEEQRQRLAQIKMEGAEHDLATKKALNDARVASKRPAPAADAAPEAAGKGSKALDVLTALEAAHTLGVPGLPHPDDIPVIGPLLGLYLKFRALKAVIGKVGGRVPATGEAKAAALAAKTKDRVVTAVDRILGVAERAAPAARTVAVSGGVRLEEMLAKRLFDTGQPEPTKGTVPELAAARAREVHAAAANPDAIVAQVRKQMAGVTDPDLIAAVEKHQVAMMKYLATVAPTEPPPSPLVKTAWSPSPAMAAAFARRLAVAENPVCALEQVTSGQLTPEAAQTLRAVHPQLFALAQQRLVEKMASLQTTIAYQQRCRASLLFDTPLDRSLNPATIHSLQTAHLPAPATNSPAAPTQQSSPPTPSLAGPVNLTALVQPAADRLASRR